MQPLGDGSIGYLSTGNGVISRLWISSLWFVDVIIPEDVYATLNEDTYMHHHDLEAGGFNLSFSKK